MTPDLAQPAPGIDGRHALFDVEILYREPLYEVWADQGPRKPYVARYRGIQAGTLKEAARIAQGQFRQTARDSGVRWHREVVEVRVHPQH